MNNGPSNDPSPSSAPQPERTLLEVRAAFVKATLGSSNVGVDFSTNMITLEALARREIFNIGAEVKSNFTGPQVELEASDPGAELELEFESSSRTFETETLSRRASSEEAAVLISPIVITPAYDDRVAPTKQFFLPQWQTLHPEILDMFNRPDQVVGSGPKQTRVATSQSYKEVQDGLLNSRIGIMFKTDQAGVLEKRVMWSTPAFLEVATRLEESFKDMVGVKKIDASAEVFETPDGKVTVEDLKLGNRRGTASRGEPVLKTLDLDTFIDRCPNYLAGLIAKEVITRINRESREQDLIKDPTASISEIKLRENWDIGVKMIIGGEKRELVISKRNQERLDFDWADLTASVADFMDADVYMPKPEVSGELDEGGFNMEHLPPADTIEPHSGEDEL